MRLIEGLSKLVFIVMDLMGAFLLALYGLLLGPLGILRGPLVLDRFFGYVAVLAPIGALARAVRTAVDWRLGHFDVAIAQAESIISLVEESIRKKPASRWKRRVLEDLYTLLLRAYLHAGHIDAAMQVMIRAQKVLKIERLGSMAGLDAKTAHLVRAGMAAGRLLDGGGLATMFVRQGAPDKGDAAKSNRPRLDGNSEAPKRAGASARSEEGDEDGQSRKGQSGAKVLHFPTIQS